MTELLMPVEAVALELVAAELASARAKFGQQLELSDDEWMSVLVEEVGEAAQLINDRRLGTVPGALAGVGLAEEVIQVAAVALRWLAAMGARP